MIRPKLTEDQAALTAIVLQGEATECQEISFQLTQWAYSGPCVGIERPEETIDPYGFRRHKLGVYEESNCL